MGSSVGLPPGFEIDAAPNADLPPGFEIDGPTPKVSASRDLAAPAPVERIPGMERLGPLPGVPKPSFDVQPESLKTAIGRAVAPTPQAPQQAAPGASGEEPTIGPAAPSVLNVVRHGALGRLFGEPTTTAEAYTQPGQTPNLLRFESAVPTSAPTVVKAASEFASGLTSPENVGIMAATSGLGALESQVGKSGISKLISMGFSSQMLHDAAQQYGDAIKAYQSGDNETAARLATHGTLATAMSVLGLKHVIAPEKVAPVATPSMIREAQTPYVANPGFAVLTPDEMSRRIGEGQPIPESKPVRQMLNQSENALSRIQPKPQPRANKEQRRAMYAPPSSGPAEGVQRGVVAREQLARQYTGKTYAELPAADQLFIDGEIAKGNTGEPKPLPGMPGSDLSAPAPLEAATPQAPAQASADLAAPTPIEPPTVQPPSRVDKVTEFTPNPPTAAIPTTPESPATYQAQVDQLNSGQRRVVMLPKGEMWRPESYPLNTQLMSDPFGNVYIYRPDLISRAAIRKAAKNNTLPEVLGSAEMGKGAPDKTAIQGTPIVVSGKAADGTEVESTATDAATLPVTLEATQRVTPPNGTVEVKTPEEAVGERATTPVETPATPVEPTTEEPLAVQPITPTEGGASLASPQEQPLGKEVIQPILSPAMRPIIDHSILSPSGKASRRATEAAQERNRVELFGESGLQQPMGPQLSESETLRQQAAELQSLADRGMKPRAYAKKAASLTARADELDRQSAPPTLSTPPEIGAKAEAAKMEAPPASDSSVTLASGLGALQPFAEKVQKARAGANPPTTPGEIYAKEQIARRETAREAPYVAMATKVKAAIAKLKGEVIDSTAPILDALREAQEKHGFEVRPSADIKYNIDRAHRATSIAEQFIHDNGLDRIIRDVEDVDYLDQYLIAKHAAEVERVHQTADKSATPRNLIKDAIFVDEFKDRIAIPATADSPALTYDQVAKQVSEYSRKVLDYSVDSGLIAPELASKLKSMYPDYVPLNRVFSAVETEAFSGMSGRAIASLSKQSVVMKLEGSQREIENPLWSILQKTQTAFRQGEINKAAAQLAGYRNLPGMKDLIRPLLAKEKMPSSHTFSVFENGEKVTYVTTPEIAAAAKSLDVHSIGLLGQILGVPGRVMKIGTTGINLPFIASNVISDQLHTLVTSRHDTALANPGAYFRAFMAAVKHDDLWHEVVREGAGFTSFDQYRGQPSSTIESIRRTKNATTRVAHLVDHPIASMGELFREMEDIVSRSEEFGRARVYIMTKESLMKAGRTEADAKILAALEANNALPNYLGSGSRMRPLNAVIPYLNAGIQGVRSFTRAMKRDPIKTSASIATALYFPVTMATLWNLSDPDRKKAYQDVQEYEKDNNIVILMPHPGKDKQGRYDAIRIKLPPGLNELTIPLRRAIEAMAGLDPLKFGEVVQAAIGSVSPIEPNLRSLGSAIIPQAIKPGVQAVANYDFFRGKPKVPGRLQELPPDLQAQPYTSGTARKISAPLGVSPIKTEEFIKDTLGGIGSQVLNASDHALFALGAIPKEQIGGASTLEAMTTRFSKVRSGEMENREFQTRTTLMQAAERKAIEAAQKTPYYQRIHENPALAQKYIESVAARARAMVLKTTGSSYYKRMEVPQKLAELKKVQARIDRQSVSGQLTRPVKPPIVPASQRERYATPRTETTDLAAPTGY